MFGARAEAAKDAAVPAASRAAELTGTSDRSALRAEVARVVELPRRLGRRARLAGLWRYPPGVLLYHLAEVGVAGEWRDAVLRIQVRGAHFVRAKNVCLPKVLRLLVETRRPKVRRR